nr:hypothetical protein CFP56_53693 [Quercus suber]
MISASKNSEGDTARSESLATLKGLLSPTGTRSGKHGVPLSQQRPTGKQPVKSAMKRRPEVTNHTFGGQPEMREMKTRPQRLKRLSLQDMDAHQDEDVRRQAQDTQDDDIARSVSQLLDSSLTSQMASQNGINGNAHMYSGMNGSVMPSAGHYADMQTLMQNMENLSGWLQQNREEWLQVQDGLARVERMQGGSSKDDLPNGELQRMLEDFQPCRVVLSPEADIHPAADLSEPTNLQLQTALAQAHQHIASLERASQHQQLIQQQYDEALQETTQQIRHYCFEQQQHTIALHQHYTTLLSQSRNETLEAQLKHQAWQASLTRLNGDLRAAVTAREEEGRPWRRRVAALREENRILRQKVGWEPLPRSDDEEEEEIEAGGARIERGRIGLPHQSTSVREETPQSQR